jgi:hypothetical protein
MSSLLQYKLLRTLDDHAVDSILTSAALNREIIRVLETHDDLLTLHQKYNLDVVISQYCDRFSRYPILLDKVSKLQKKIPQAFQQGCFCAWLSLVITEQLSQNKNVHSLYPESRFSCFVAALCQNLGLLHINPMLAEKSFSDILYEKKAIYSHPLISQLIVSAIHQLPKDIPRAIVEHHERWDGSGYPKGLVSDEISILGKILGACDMVYTLRFKFLAKDSGNLRDILSLIHIKPYAKSDLWLRDTLIHLFSQVACPVKKSSKTAESSSICKTILANANWIAHWILIVDDYLKILPKSCDNRRLNGLKNLIERLWYNLSETGVVSASMMRWIQHANETPSAFFDIEMDELRLMYREILWQFQKIEQLQENLLPFLVKNSSANALQYHLISTKMKKLIDPNLRDSLPHIINSIDLSVFLLKT